MTDLAKCPFVRLVAAGREQAARDLAASGPDPAEPAVADWLVSEARRHLAVHLYP